MSKVILEVSEYKELLEKAREVEESKQEIIDLKQRHDKEINELMEEGKIAVMVESPFGRLFGGKPHVLKVVGLDKVRPQFEEAIVNEEVSKANAKLIKELAEAQTKASDLEAEVERLKGRGLIARILNK